MSSTTILGPALMLPRVIGRLLATPRGVELLDKRITQAKGVCGAMMHHDYSPSFHAGT